MLFPDRLSPFPPLPCEAFLLDLQRDLEPAQWGWMPACPRFSLILRRTVNTAMRKHSPGAPVNARFDAVAYQKTKACANIPLWNSVNLT